MACRYRRVNYETAIAVDYFRLTKARPVDRHWCTVRTGAIDGRRQGGNECPVAPGMRTYVNGERHHVQDPGVGTVICGLSTVKAEIASVAPRIMVDLDSVPEVAIGFGGSQAFLVYAARRRGRSTIPERKASVSPFTRASL